jgi:hypothetical protein
VALRNQPYLPLYVNDFMNDEKLKPCSAESIGVYIRLMCLLHKCEEYGALTFDDLDERTNDICYDFATKLLPHLLFKHDVVLRGLHELIARKILMLDGERLYQKRMVKDGNTSAVRVSAGSAGGKAKAKNSSKTSSKRLAKGVSNADIDIVIDNDIESESKPTKPRGFRPHSLADVSAYCKERGNKVDAETFIDFYTAKDWKIGNNKMKDWKACVRTWEKRDNYGGKPNTRKGKTVIEQQYTQREYTDVENRIMNSMRPEEYRGAMSMPDGEGKVLPEAELDRLTEEYTEKYNRGEGIQ